MAPISRNFLISVGNLLSIGAKPLYLGKLPTSKGNSLSIRGKAPYIRNITLTYGKFPFGKGISHISVKTPQYKGITPL